MTLQRAHQRARGNSPTIDEFYNGLRVDAYGWNYVQGVEKYRFVGIGIVRGPFDTVLSGTLTLSSGPAFGNTHLQAERAGECLRYANMGGVLPEGDVCLLEPRPAYREEGPDAVGQGPRARSQLRGLQRVRLGQPQLCRLGAGSGQNPTFEENGTVGNARSFQVGAKYKFWAARGLQNWGRGAHPPPFLLTEPLVTPARIHFGTNRSLVVTIDDFAGFRASGSMPPAHWRRSRPAQAATIPACAG